jgi:hypothetical protein
MLNYFEINSQSDFNNIPEDTQSLIINARYKTHDKHTSFLNNLPVSLKEIHFDNGQYFFNSKLCYVDSNILQFYDEIPIIEYFIKIPFNCKIFNFHKPILKFDGFVKMYQI